MNAETPPEPSRSCWKRVGVHLTLVGVAAAAFAFWAVANLSCQHDHVQSPEIQTVSFLLAYAEMQVMYRHGGDWDKDGVREYADELPRLYDTKRSDGELVEFAGKNMAAAHGPEGTPKAGYLFLEPRTIAGKRIDWSKDYALCGTPAAYGSGTRRTLILWTPGIVWAKDLGKSKFLKDFPADPAAEGWELIQRRWEEVE